MRQRKLLNLPEKLAEFEDLRVLEKDGHQGKWRQVFEENEEDPIDPETPLDIEIGCGKGQFISTLAALHPERRYLAVEGNESVGWYALRKIRVSEAANVRVLLAYIDKMTEVFAENEVDRIYMNFSDPWPKKRHAKRRLTEGHKLEEYAKALKPGGTLEFKTDNDGLFAFSIEEMEACPFFEIEYKTDDLHRDVPADQIVMTEYEKKFSDAGKNIHYVRLRVIK